MEYNNALPAGVVLRGTSQTYRIEKVLGQGSFGITYLATTKVKVTGPLGEIETAIQVAVKEFFMREINGREDSTVTSGSKGGIYDNYKRKFSREARNLSLLKHPHIVKVLESFEANNTVYYAMEYMEGGSLDNRIIQRGGLPEAECMDYLRQIGSALSYMHAHKMLHLDLKPGNVMLRKDGSAVLIDFGLSKQYDENGEPESSTTVGGGTPGYAPIEQASYHEGKSFPVTMDVYALGATGYKMLTGIRPPEASDVLNDGFPAYELQKCQVSDALIASIAKAMSPMKKDRPQSVDEFLRMLSDGGGRVDEETQVKERIVLDAKVQKLSFWYSEPSHPGSRSFDMEITPALLKVNSYIMGNPVKALSLPFTGSFRGLLDAVNRLKLYKSSLPDADYSTGGHHIGLRVNNEQTLWHYGNREHQSGSLTGDVYDLLELMKRQMPAAEYQRLWSKMEKREEPVRPKKNDREKTWWEKNGMLLLIPVGIVAVCLLVLWGTGTFSGGDTGYSEDWAVMDSSVVDDYYYGADSVVAADSVMVVEEPYADSVAVFEEPEQEPEQELVSLPKSTSEEIYEGVYYEPEFPGGAEQLSEYLYRHLDYPAEAQESGIEGRVLVSFVVNKDGSLSDVKVRRSVDPSLDREAVRVVSGMPKWTPGRLKDGQTVRVRYTLPITFRLS